MGRPKGFAGVAREIMSATDNGRELVDYALSVWRDKERPHTERAWAHGWLSDRGLGKPLQTTELHAFVAPSEEDELVDTSHLSVEQLRELVALDDRRAALLAAANDNTQVPNLGAKERSNEDR